MTQKVTGTFVVSFTFLMTSKGHSIIRARLVLFYDPKGHDDLCGQFALVYDPKKSQGHLSSAWPTLLLQRSRSLDRDQLYDQTVTVYFVVGLT